MTFEWPWAFALLAVVPLAALGLRLVERRRMRHAIRFPNVDVLAAVAARERSWTRLAGPALFLLALAATLAALARPHAFALGASEQASIVLTLDSSGSMMADDVRPTRLDAARAAIRSFLKRVPRPVRVGLITFSGEPQVIAPLTGNRQLISEGLDCIAPGYGTAIGDAIDRSVALATEGGGPGRADGRRPLRAIILLSDGSQRGGILEPLEGAAKAKAAGIPVYTVALGTPDGVLQFGGGGGGVDECGLPTFQPGRFGPPNGGFDRGGGETESIPVPPDTEMLRRIAQATGGEFFDARSAGRLKDVYERLGSKLARKKVKREYTNAFLGGAAALLLLAAGASARFGPRLP